MSITKAIKYTTMVFAVSLLTVSCAGKGGVSALPSTRSGSAVSSTGTTPQNFGMGLSVAPTLAAAPSGWANTATQAVGPKLVSATEIGALPATTPLTVRLGLQMRSPAQLTALIAAHQTLSNGAFMASYAPTPAQTSAVTAYLQSSGFTNITVEPNNLLVSANGTAAQVNAAFDTSLLNYTQNGQTVYANATPALVPTALGGIVISVLGLNNAIQALMPIVKAQGLIQSTSSTPNNCPEGTQFNGPNPCGNTASSLWTVYDAGTTPTGGETNFANMAEGNVTGSISDFRLTEKLYQVRQVPITVIPVGPPSSDTSGAPEWTLDMSAASGIAGNLHHIFLYVTSALYDQDIALEASRWATDDRAEIGNSSFGGCEYGPYIDGSMTIDDEAYAQGASQGQTMFASAGDDGGFCSVGVPNGVPVGAPLAMYPCASPYVVCVGGTSLFTNPDGSYLGEQTWVAGGGGQSQLEFAPPWEVPTQPIGNADSAVESIRGTPDIAMDADPQTGLLMYAGGVPSQYGGTSLASPLSAGVWARLESAHGERLGFAAPVLYQDYVDNPTAGAITTGPPAVEPRGGYRDIIVGSNGSYTALPGFDYTTGMGTFDISVMNGLIGADAQKL